MAGPPLRLLLPSGVEVVREPGFLVIGLRRPFPVDEFQTRLSAVPGYELVGGPPPSRPGTAGGAASPFIVNHSTSHYWVEAAGDDRSHSPAAFATAFGLDLDYVAPVYRLPGTIGLVGLVAVVPNLVFVRPVPGKQAELDARVAAELPELEAVAAHATLTGGRRLKYRLRSLDSADVSAIRERLIRYPDLVRSAHLQHIPVRKPLLFTPNDGSDPAHYYQAQWNLPVVEAEAGWDTTQGDPAVFVCVIDDGVALNHPDLTPNLPDQGVDVGDPTRNADVVDPAHEWHGTHVAGVAGGRINNARGIAGLAGRGSIYPIKFDFSDQQFADALYHALTFATAAAGRRMVINLSFGWTTSELAGLDFAAMDQAITEVHTGNCLLCAGTGNGSGSAPDADDLTHNLYPARHPRVMACGGSDQFDRRLDDGIVRSQYGMDDYAGERTGVSVVAPGHGIWSTSVDLGYEPLSGTSFASPHVAALGALLFAKYGLTAPAARSVIERTAAKVHETGSSPYPYADAAAFPNGRRNDEVGYGRISARQALDFADVYIRDWPLDAGTEPSQPPNHDYWSTSDIVVRPTDDGVFLPDQPLEASRVARGQTNYVYVRVRNAGPADAREVKVSVRVAAFVGVSFTYPTDWTLTDGTHVAPALVTALPIPVLVSGTETIVKFTLSSEQVETLWDWKQGQHWSPCLLAEVAAANDYAWAAASPDSSGLLTRQNNLAQRNLTIVDAAPAAEVLAAFMVGHELDPSPEVRLIFVTTGSRPFTVTLDLAGKRKVFTRARESAPGPGLCGLGPVWTDLGRIEIGASGERTVALVRPVTRLRVARPPGGRHEIQLRVGIPRDALPRELFRLDVMREAGGAIVGGASFLFVVPVR